MTTDLDRRLNEKYRAVVDEHTWMEPEILDRLATKTRLENASQKSRRQSLMHLAERFNAALAPQAACKAGCSACCSMTTMIYEHEAEALAAASGRPMKRLPFRLHNGH